MFCERIKVSAKHVSANSTSSDIYTLSKEEMDFYKENGYIVIRGLFERNSLYKYKQHFADICNGKEQRALIIKEVPLMGNNKKIEEYINKIQDILHDEVFMTYSESPKILDIVSQFIGNEITAVNLTLINKPPGTMRHPPHQDLYYFPFRPVDKIIGVWTAVDPARVLNGCLFVVPGSHKIGEILKHENVPGDSKKLFHRVVNEDKYAPLDKRMHLEMDPGDTVFFHPYLLHGSGPNLTQPHSYLILSDDVAQDTLSLVRGLALKCYCRNTPIGAWRQIYNLSVVASQGFEFMSIDAMSVHATSEPSLANMVYKTNLKKFINTYFFNLCHSIEEYRKALTIHYASSNCNYIDVTGTVQQDIADEYKRVFKKRGLDMEYVDVWKIKCKLVRGVHSNL